MSVLNHRENRLFLLLGGFFICNALIAEFIGVKIFSLESTLGIDPLQWTLLGEQLQFDLTAGVLIWPVVFIMTDIINEYYGTRGVRFLSFMAVGLICFAFLAVFIAIRVTPAEWWVGNGQNNGVVDMQAAFQKIFGQGLWIIFGSLVAFLVGQLLDVLIFHRLKKITGDKAIWLRATGSTLVSQLIDSFIVLFIAFYLGDNWSMAKVTAIGLNNYIYKFTLAIALTPLIYMAHYFIDRYLGHEVAERLKKEASGE